jgi:hypothetical protein
LTLIKAERTIHCGTCRPGTSRNSGRRHEDLALHFVSDTEVTKVPTFPILIAVLEEAHRRPKMEVLDAFLGGEGAQYARRRGPAGIDLPWPRRHPAADRQRCDQRDRRPRRSPRSRQRQRAGTRRASASDITFFKNAGGDHLDLMTCEAVFKQLSTKFG